MLPSRHEVWVARSDASTTLDRKFSLTSTHEGGNSRGRETAAVPAPAPVTAPVAVVVAVVAAVSIARSSVLAASPTMSATMGLLKRNLTWEQGGDGKWREG